MFAALLAGVGKMPYRRILVYNVLGGACWAVIMGGLGYTLGRNLPLLERSVRWLGLGGAGVLILVVASVLYLRRHRNLLCPQSLDHAPSGARLPSHYSADCRLPSGPWAIPTMGTASLRPTPVTDQFFRLELTEQEKAELSEHLKSL